MLIQVIRKKQVVGQGRKLETVESSAFVAESVKALLNLGICV